MMYRIFFVLAVVGSILILLAACESAVVVEEDAEGTQFPHTEAPSKPATEAPKKGGAAVRFMTWAQDNFEGRAWVEMVERFQESQGIEVDLVVIR